jgi:hypothetical protein
MDRWLETSSSHWYFSGCSVVEDCGEDCAIVWVAAKAAAIVSVSRIAFLRLQSCIRHPFVRVRGLDQIFCSPILSYGFAACAFIAF